MSSAIIATAATSQETLALYCGTTGYYATTLEELAWSPDSAHLASASEDGSVQV